MLIAVLNTVTLNQFSRLPLLVVHYIDHWHRDQNVTIADFLTMHYFGNDIDDNDSEQDKQLPLKSFSADSFQTFTTPSVSEINIHPSFTYNTSREGVAREPFFPAQHIFSLFRPPRA